MACLDTGLSANGQYPDLCKMTHATKSNGITSSQQDTVSCEVGLVGIFSKVAVVSTTSVGLLPPITFFSLPITSVVVGIAIGFVFPPQNSLCLHYNKLLMIVVLMS